MKSSSKKKLRDLSLSRHAFIQETSFDSVKAEEEQEEPPDLTQGMEDVENIKSQYEGLLTSGLTISGAAYDFSQAIQGMASCMLDTSTHFLDPETENIFSMLAKVQFEISKLLDLFASHVSQSIISPTEMMMNELQQVKVMKEQYDEKREVYNLTLREIQKGNLKSGKGASFNQQIALAKTNFIEHAHALSFRLQSLKQGQSLSLSTQAARYHSAQMHLFSKGLASISAMELVMDQIASTKNIDRTLSEDDTANDDASFRREGDLSNSGGDDSKSITSSPSVFQESQTSGAQTLEEPRVIYSKAPNCKSAPILSALYQHELKRNQHELKDNPIEGESTRNYVSMYALPSPTAASERNGSESIGNEGSVGHEMKMPLFLWEHKDNSSNQSTTKKSSTFQKNFLSDFREEGYQSSSVPKIGRSFSHSGRHENTSHSSTIPLSHVKQINPSYKSGPISRSSMMVTQTSHSDSTISPQIVFPPQISELHKLPLPPSPIVGTGIPHSAPFAKTPLKSPPLSPLPTPPTLGARSLSTPASAKHIINIHQHGENNAREKFPFPRTLKSVILPGVNTSTSS